MFTQIMTDNDLDDYNEKVYVRSYADVLKEKQNAKLVTHTSKEQDQVEESVLKIFKLNKEPILNKFTHIQFLKSSLNHLSKNYECLDSSRPWLCYWILHSLQILGVRLEDEDYSKIVGFLSKCQDPEGGFGGGPGQYPHLASSYAAINALCCIGTEEAYNVINRPGLQKFLKSLHNPDGSFCMHKDGEIDIRGVYCALVVAKLTNVYTPELFKNSAKWISDCQNWEGGFSGCPGMEAHGGYAYCGLASLVLLEKTDVFNLPAFIRWIVNRQMKLEGGFQGRTNKLVDGCYSLWQGGAFPLIHALLAKEKNVILDHWLFDQAALQEYLLICCQYPLGGILDKPEKNVDIYHTCYGLSGLSVAQHSPRQVIIGPQHINTVKTIHPVYNLVYSSAVEAVQHFLNLPIPK